MNWERSLNDFFEYIQIFCYAEYKEKRGIVMGTFKNQKDKIVGSAKEKIGEMLNKDELIDEGRAQSEVAKENDERYQARINELEDQQAEKEAKEQDLTQERHKEDPTHKKTPLPEADHIPEQQKIDEQRRKHYTGIEEKL